MNYYIYFNTIYIMSSVFEKALSLEWNGKVFILTMRNEITANTTVAGNTFLYSYDGKSWLPSSNITTSSLSNTNPYNVKWTGQKYLMETSTNINQSRDGLNWSALNTTFPVKPNLTLANFSTLSPTNLSDTNIALSGDGTMVVVSKYASGSTIYYSKYSSGSWSTLTSTGISTAGVGWKGISLSYFGSPMLISGSENSLYILSAGTWIKSAVFSPSDTQGSALSQDGTRAVFAFYSGGFGFFSYSGSSWSSQTSVTINTTTYPSATYANFKGIGMNLQGTTVVLYATSNSSFFYSNYNGSTWSALTLILTSTVVPPMNLNNGIEIDFWNNIYIGGYGSRYVFYSAYNAKAVGNKWSEFSTIVDAGSYNPIGFSVSENGRMAIAASNGNSYVYDNIVSGIYDVEVNLEQTNTISFPQNTTLALGGILADTTKIAYSTDSGLTWTPAQSSASVFSTSCNNATWNGKIWVAVGSGGNTIATSPDGRTWTGRGSYIFTTQGNAVEWSKELCLWVAVGQGTNSIAYSTDGIYWLSALASSSQGLTSGTDIKWNSRTWVATGTSSLIGIFTSSDGQNWAQVPPSNIALPPVTNYGGVWTQATQTTNTWLVNAMNYTGQYQTAVDASGAVYISSNFGAAWSYSQFTLPSFVQPLVAFLAINSSGSQQYLLIGGGGLWISSNYGAAWSYNNNLASNTYWTSVATDSIGLYVLASSASSVGASAGLWLSTNSGGVWAQIGSYSNIPFNGCTVSATGQYMSAIDIYGGIYISSNFGVTWTISVAGSGFVVPTKIAGSSSGQYLTASDYGTNTYTVDAYYTMLSSATNGAMDTAGNIYIGGSQSVPSQAIYKISSSGSGMVVTPIGNVGVYVNQNFAIAIDNTNGFLYFIGVSGPTVYKTVIATGVTTGLTALNTSLNGVSTATPSGIVCDTLGNLYILTASTGGTTAYICAYTTSSVFSTIITKTVTTGGLGLGIDKSNNIYLSYPTQVDQYSTGGTLTLSGFYNSGRLVKYMTFDTTGNGYFYDVSGVYKVTLGQSSTYPLTQTFISGNFFNIYGIAQDNIGNFYIADGNQNRIQQYTSTGSLLNVNFITGTNWTVGIAFDQFNNFYTVNYGNSSVYQYKITNGSLTSSNKTFITTGLSNPASIAFDKLGNCYVTSDAAGANTGYVSKYTLSNTSTNTILTTNNSFITNCGYPWGIICDSIGNVYYAENYSGNIKKYSTDGQLTTFISGLTSPSGITFDSAYNMYVTNGSVVSKYSYTGTLINLNYVTNGGSTVPICDSSDNLYITNYGNNTVTKTSIVSNSTLITGLSSPQYTCVDSTGAVYTTNATAGTVTKYGPIGSVFTSSGMNGAEQIGFDNNGYAYVSNYGGTISQYNSSGALLNANFITGGSSSIGMVLDNQNNIYLVNRPTGSTGYIAKYAITNGSLSSSNTSFITSLSGPQALVIDSNNYLYISQTNNYGTTTGFISKYTTSGILVTASFISSLNNPNQMAFDSYGNIYIALTNGNYITKYSYNGTLISSTFIAFTSPIGLAIDSYNNIYVSQSLSTGFVSKYNSTGILVSANYANIGGIQLNYLSLDSSNNLYAVSGTNIVYKITNTNQTIISGLSSPTGCTIDSANNLYISNSGVGNIALYGQSLAASTTPQSTSTFANTGLASPFMVCMDNYGYIYVINANATTANSVNTVIQYNSNNTVKNANFIPAISASETRAWGMAIDAYNNMYIVTGNQNKVFQYAINSSGNITASNTSFITSGLSTPQSCCFDSAGNFYVSCYNGGTGYINKYGMANGIITTTTANYITGIGNTWQMAFDSLNNIYVCNLNGNIYKYGPSGTLISNTFITIVTPMGITIDSFGYIYVSVYSSSGYIAKYNSTGTLVNSSYVTSLNYPAQLSYYQGNLYIPVSTGTSQTTGSILKLTTAINPTYITGLSSPQGCCFDNSNNFYVSNSNSITKTVPNITPNNLTAYGTGLGAFCLTVDPSNNIYVSFSSSPWLAMFTSTGTFVKTLISSPTSIYGVTYYNGYIYAFNNNTGNNVYRYNLSTNTSSVLISISNYPIYGSFDKSGNLYISIYYSPGSYGYIGMYTSEGVVLNANLITGTAAASSPYGTCFDSLGYFYVNWTSGTSPKITKYLLNGTSAPTVIFNITIPGGARSLTIDAYNNLFYGTSTIYVYSSIYNNNLFYTYSVANVGCDTITFDINGNILYWKYSASAGNLVRLTISPSTSIIASITNPTSIISDSTNNLYINTGTSINTLTNSTSSTFATITSSSFGCCSDINNNIYVASGSTNLSKITPSGVVTTSFITSSGILDCKIDNQGNFFVVSSGGYVYKFPSSGGSTATYTFTVGSSPHGGVFDSFNNFYVVNYSSNTISKINSGATSATGVTVSYVTGLNGPFAITCDSNNNLYAANFGGGNISIIAYGSTTSVTLVTVSQPTGCCFNNNFLYIASFNTNTVIKYNIVFGTQTTYLSSGLSSPIGITTDNSYNLFIVNNGSTILTKISLLFNTASYITGLTTSKGLTIDTSKNFYVTSGSTVQKYNSSGTIITSTYLQNLSSPIGLAIDSVQNLYVVQNGSNSINRYNNNIHLSQTIINSSSNTLTAYLPSSYGFSTNPTNLFNIDSENNLYLSAPYPSNSFVIYKYSAFTLSTYYANAATPYLANDSSYNLYWTTTANTVVKFNPYTKSQSIFIDISGSQQGVSILQAPSALTFDIAQNLYLCCSGNIIKVAAGSKAVSTFSTIQATYAIIADSSSNIYAMAATTPSHTVYKITQAGVQTTFFDSTKGLYSGYGLAIDAPGNIYIGSVNQAQTQTVIYKISPQGTQTTVYTTSTVNPVLGYAPLSVDKYGNLYLYDNNQIIVINPNGNSSTISNVSTLPTSFAFDNTNTIYMTDTSYNTSLNTILMGNTTLNTSSNYGATWTVGSLQNITAIANAGQYQSVIANGQIYISSNYGSTFNVATGLGFSNIKSVALSQGSQGGYFQTGIQSTGNIYTSNQVSYSNITKILWNGTYWTGVIAGVSNPVLTSANGISWTNLPGNPFSGNIIQNGFYSSRTGQTLFIGSYTGSVTVPTFTTTPSNAFGNTITQNSITTLYNTSNNINSISNVVLPSISNTISITQNTTQPTNSVSVLGAYNLSTWGVTTFPDTTALWIWNIPGAASSAPPNQNSPIIFQYTYNNTTNSSISANVYIIVDDMCVLYINGIQYGSTLISGGWPNAATNVPITIVPGKNVFQIPSVNGGASANPAGLLVTVIANSVVLFNSNASWTYQNASIGSPNAITYNGTYYLLGGNAVASSPDTRTWTYGSAISGMSQINNFAWNNPDQGSASIAPLSVAVGSGSNTIAYSIDGIYWQGTGNSVFTVQGNKAVWNGQLWCAVGMGGYWVATSYDGIVWTGRDNYWMQQGYDIAWNGQIFIAVGYGLVTMVASSDGINWQGIVRTPLNIYASSITWTGKIWLAYGAGDSTSTAYSPQILGGGWQSTPQASIAIQNGQTVFTPAYFTTESLAGYSATASSQQVGNESYRAFDNKFSATTGQVTSWYSAAGTYAAATGQYLGSQTTSYNNNLSITGEWLQIQLPQPTIAIYYYVVFAIDSSNTAIPKGWTLLGSQTGTSWTLIENFSFGSQTTPPNNTNGYPFLVIPRNINIGATYQYYRIVIPAVFGNGATTFAEIAEFDIYTATSATNQLNYLTRPIVTKTHVLHPTNLINVQGIGYPTFYIATDLCGNQINNYYLNQAGYANSLVYGLGAAYPVAQTFDGQNYLVLANSGAATYLSNQAANTTLNFSPTYNGTTIQTNITQAYAAAYNKRSILLGGANGQIGSITYATLGMGSSPIFRATNAAALFTAVYGLASNSGYGPVYVPNAIYMKPQEKISIIGPKAYPSAVSNTAITMNLTNAQILTNITNSLNSIAIYGATGPQGPPGAIGTQGLSPIGPVGWVGQIGYIGQQATSGSQGQIGYFGLVGPTGPKAPYWQVLGNSISYPSKIGINNSAPSYEVDISGTTNITSIAAAGLGQVLQNIQVGGISTMQTQVDISGSMVVSNSMILGGTTTPPGGGLFIIGSQSISNISYMNQIIENLSQGAPDNIGNLVLDISQTNSWVLDMSNCPNNIACQINNIPSILITGIIYLTIYLDYSQSSSPGYYINSIIIGSQTYTLLFENGSPSNTINKTYIKQSIKIFITNSQIVRILSTI